MQDFKDYLNSVLMNDKEAEAIFAHNFWRLPAEDREKLCKENAELLKKMNIYKEKCLGTEKMLEEQDDWFKKNIL